MSVAFVEGLPGLADAFVTLRTRRFSAFVRSPRFIARFSLRSGKIEWLVERSPISLAECSRLPRYIRVFDADLWISEADDVIVEIMTTESGALAVTARAAETGKEL